MGRKRETGHDGMESGETSYAKNGGRVHIEIEKTGAHSRRITSRIVVEASIETVWDVLTDYERLAEFIPGLAVSRLVAKGDKFARVFQSGKQELAFGLKFKAEATLDCFEKDVEILPSGQKRDIEFKMIEGDFRRLEGKWSIVQEQLQGDSLAGREYETTLTYFVNVESKVWQPIGFVEGRLCRELRTNMSCLREQAEKAFPKHVISSPKQIDSSTALE